MMQYFRCKCGRCQSWSSMGVDPCDKCYSCGSGLAQGPDSHVDPVPHDFTEIRKVQTDQGIMTITSCKHCHRTRDEIKKLDERKQAAELAERER